MILELLLSVIGIAIGVTMITVTIWVSIDLIKFICRRK